MQISDIGNNMYSKKIDKKVKIYKIQKKDLEQITITSKEKEMLEFVNFKLEDLVDKYIDKEGNIYVFYEEGLYLFNVKIKSILTKDITFIIIEK